MKIKVKTLKKAMIFIVVLLVIVMVIFASGLFRTGGKKVKLETNHGDVIILLREDVPVTAGNFEKLVSSGFYDKVIFHRVIEGFMIQGGDPRAREREGRDIR